MRKKQHMKTDGRHFFFFWFLKTQGWEIRNPTEKSPGLTKTSLIF